MCFEVFVTKFILPKFHSSSTKFCERYKCQDHDRGYYNSDHSKFFQKYKVGSEKESM